MKMTNTYYPDKWELVKIKGKDMEFYKIFASFYGGFTNGDSWKISSGVIEVIEHEYHYSFINSSGSIYECNKDATGMSLYSSGIYETLKGNMELSGFSMETIDVKEYFA